MTNRLKEDIELIRQVLNEIIEWNLSELGDDFDFREHVCDSDLLMQHVNSCVDVYDYDLRLWAVDNYDYCEQALEQGLVDTEEFDYHNLISNGQLIYYSELMNEAVAEKLEEYESNNIN